MIQFVHTYPYLMLSLTMFGIFMIGLGVCPRQFRPTMILSGALAAPFALTSALVVPEYWNPARVAVFLAGPEDIVFTFASASIAWLASVWLLRHRITLLPRPRRMIWRYIGGAVGGLVVGGIGCRLGGSPNTATVAAFSALTLIILWRRRWFWSLAFAGSLGYAILYVSVLKIWYVLVPDFVAQWNSRALWGPVIFGLPLDEIIWAAAFGAAWPVFAMYLFDSKLLPRARIAAPAVKTDGGHPTEGDVEQTYECAGSVRHV